HRHDHGDGDGISAPQRERQRGEAEAERPHPRLGGLGDEARALVEQRGGESREGEQHREAEVAPHAAGARLRAHPLCASEICHAIQRRGTLRHCASSSRRSGFRLAGDARCQRSSLAWSQRGKERDEMIEITGVSRSFGDRRVLSDVSFGVESGRMTGFVGGNGAGKTTTMRIILGVLSADSGTVALDGELITAADRARFGYMPEERGLYPKMKVLEQLVYLGRLHGMSAHAAKASASGLVERLGLGERANATLESLSL